MIICVYDKRNDLWDIDPISGNDAGSHLCTFYEKYVSQVVAAYTDRICSRGYGGSLCVESFNPINRTVIQTWKMLLFTGCYRILDRLVPNLNMNSEASEGPDLGLKKTTMLVLAVTIHNIPEGMAVGVVFAGWISGNTDLTFMGAMALSVGIAIQNFPEGAIISMPLRAEGMTKRKAFVAGVLSGVVEPVAAVLTILASCFVIPVLPYLLSFAAGAMIYVVVEELIPEMSEGEHSNVGTLMFAVGFTLMMALDVALG